MAKRTLQAPGMAQPSRERAEKSRGQPMWWFPALLAVCVVAIYASSFNAPFIFDDEPAIVGNSTIRQLWPITSALHPPADGAGVTGRPLTNLSFALNYAVSGLDVRAYRLTNALLHFLAALTLWGVIRHTIRLTKLKENFRLNGELIGVGATLLWTVHPLLTECVIFVVQRNEILAGLFYLLTFYSVLRATDSTTTQRGRWTTLAIASCYFGMASKEVMATCPLLVLLFDRTFIAGSFRAAWRERRGLYLGLASSWIFLAYLMSSTGQRAGTVGFGLGVTPWDYLLTQCRAVFIYLQLSIWPHPLVIDYGTDVVQGAAAVWPQALGLCALLTGATWSMFHQHRVRGFLGVALFVILAPSSSIVPLTTQTIAEHRMYLPLATVIVFIVGGLADLTRARWILLTVVASLATGCGLLTILRGRDYRNARSIWSDTLVKAPLNARAHLNFGKVLFLKGNLNAARNEYEIAARLKPNYAEAHYSLGLVASRQGKPQEAVQEYERALEISPDYEQVRNDLAGALVELGRRDDALRQLDLLLQEQPQTANALVNRGRIYFQLHRWTEAKAAWEEALRVDGKSLEALTGLGNLAMADHRPGEAVFYFAEANKLLPRSLDLLTRLAGAEMQSGQRGRAVTHYRNALELAPASAELQLTVGLALAGNGQLAEALEHCTEAMRLKPDFPAAQLYVKQLQADLKKTAP